MGRKVGEHIPNNPQPHGLRRRSKLLREERETKIDFKATITQFNREGELDLGDDDIELGDNQSGYLSENRRRQ